MFSNALQYNTAPDHPVRQAAEGMFVCVCMHMFVCVCVRVCVCDVRLVGAYLQLAAIIEANQLNTHMPSTPATN